MSTTAVENPQCPYCGGIPHQHIGQCYAVQEIEYYPDGTIKRVVKRPLDRLPYVFPAGPSK